MKRVYVIINISCNGAFMCGDQTLSDKRNDLKSANFYANRADAEFNFPSDDYLKYDVECFVDMNYDKDAAKKIIERYREFEVIDLTSMLKNLEETGLVEESVFNSKTY